jgi:F-type H+-transporting ATPase subunit delta
MMNPRAAERYAKALIGLAVEQNQLEDVYDDTSRILNFCRSSREFVLFLKSPIIKPSEKNKTITLISEGRGKSKNKLAITFIKLLVNKGRESILPEILQAVEDEYNKIKQIFKIKLTTAVPVSEDTKNAIIKKIKDNTRLENIIINHVIDDSIIGGFKLELGDLLVDGSVLKDLKDIKKQFLNNEYLFNLR